MEANFWVKIKAVKKFQGWRRGNVNVSIAKPDTKVNEAAIKLTISIPDAFFEKPQLTARIEIPDDAVTQPILNADVQDNLAEVLSEQLGINVSVTLPEKL